MNRREFIVGAGAALASPFAIGKPVRSSLGADSGIKSSDGWTNPYVTDGLIAMWDGVWNVGGGVHDDNTDIVVDLTGHGHDMTFTKPYSIENNSFTITGRSGGIGHVANGWIFGSHHTQEIALLLHDLNHGRIIGQQRGIECREGYRGVYGFGVDWRVTKPDDSLFPLNPVVQSLTFDTDIDNLLRFYENGELIATTRGYSSDINNELTIAHPPEGVSGGATNVTVYNLRIYNRALTAYEIGVNYSVDKERFGL